MDHPTRGEACKVGIFDLHDCTVRTVRLPATCWHIVCHPTEDIFYALSFRVVPQDGRDWHQWGVAQLKEYVFEIDAGTGKVRRHWSAGQDTPAHINSDVCISDRELIYCNGGSGTIVLIDLESFSSYRILDVRPHFWSRLRASRQGARTVLDTMREGPSSRTAISIFARSGFPPGRSSIQCTHASFPRIIACSSRLIAGSMSSRCMIIRASTCGCACECPVCSGSTAACIGGVIPDSASITARC